MIILKSADLSRRRFTNIVVPVCEKKSVTAEAKLAALVDDVLSLPEFEGKEDDVLMRYSTGGIKADRLIFLGLGKAKQVDEEGLRRMSAKGVRRALELGQSKVSIVMPDIETLKIDRDRQVFAVIEGALMANHLFHRYRSKKASKVKPLVAIEVLIARNEVNRLRAVAEKAVMLVTGSLLARDWVSTPPMDKIPEKFAAMVEKSLEEVSIPVEIKDHKELANMHFGAMLGVAMGSDSPARLVVADYHPEGATKTVVLVGKGVTYDSGGLNLKPADGLKDMKSDMAGAAAVAGTLYNVGQLRPDVRVVGVMPLVENMPSGKALRVGDVLKSHSGKTIEVGNTDAEGRLILADALSWAAKTYKPDLMIDLATLTGACVVALGQDIAGVFANDDKLAKAITLSSDRVHERCWPLPMPEDYKVHLKSEIADIANVAGHRWGGATTAALFLSEFVGKSRWAHIDIAGPAFTHKDSPYIRPGGTGFGVRLLCDLLFDEESALKI
ncbi:leucyl aminopeptidase [Desulfoluna sp.]|uniref:leucyl aminopeptidase n=1 Tax=Desulfoluna sp. TaxID=2045199 RepID=UPI00260A9949|nr:leucyl aminopeptidase [Desulfoluna sp.]